MRTPILLAALVVAGCAAPAPADDPAASAERTWGIAECAFVIVIVPVDAARLRERLPEGFSVASTGAPLPIERASVEVDAYQCAAGEWFGRALAPLAYGSHYAAVEPPDALRENGFEAYFVKWETLVADDAARAEMLAAGLPARSGDARVEIADLAVSASLGFDDGAGFSLTGALQEEPVAVAEPLPFMEFTPLASGGLARWHARLHNASIGAGAGIVSLPEGSWVRDAAGASTVPVRFIAGTWNLDEADVAFPIAWP